MRLWVVLFSFAYLIMGLPTYSKAQAQQCEPIITTIAGNGQTGFSGDSGGQATSAALYAPYAVAVDAQGNIYIGDVGHHRVRKVTTDGIITTIAGNGQQWFFWGWGPGHER